MNASNTKLSREEKEILVDLKNEFAEKNGRVFYFKEAGMTVAMMLAGEVCKVATAISSPLEKKFRRKVGAYNAISRVMLDNEFALIPTPYNCGVWAEEFVDVCTLNGN